MIVIEDILRYARQCLGTPFRHQGRLIGVGLDCAGVIIYVARQLGLDPIDVQGYGTEPNNEQLERALDAQPCLERAFLEDRKPGDVLLMRFRFDPQHLAIFADETIIHAYQQIGQVVEHPLSDLWATRIVRVYRFQDRGIA